MNATVCSRRIMAWFVDFALVGWALALCALCTGILEQPSLHNIELLIAFVWFVVFISRDVIFSGRSVGKRLFGLCILDRNSNLPASVKQRIIRNLFLPIYTIDGIVLITTKESIGDRVSKTKVILDPQREMTRVRKTKKF